MFVVEGIDTDGVEFQRVYTHENDANFAAAMWREEGHTIVGVYPLPD